MDRSPATGYGGNTYSAQPGFSGPTMYQANTASPAPGYGGNTYSAQPGFSGPTMYQANIASPAPDYAGNTQSAEPEFSGPTMYQANTVRGTVWSTGLFDCHEDETNAVMTAFLPCVTFGQIAEVMDQGELTCPLGSLIYALMMPALCSQWLMGSKYRTRLRNRYNLVEAPYTDIISHVFCPCCSLCQEFRELRKRGLDPALGWNGILAQRQAGVGQPETVEVPPPRQNMSF
ncbi:protein PLANT CADMIUM RESISTANCE 8 [Momordica charantia]|uniref:Protein PLANT CADMIUM RESISTANCE 8 n=1 Tax=Momordica charantia TaxID=3673 RepID=A0A6J1DHK7_MOMCH|nr:protein PLANT CADMIUM RESISTANCE 8 [Momordica charantia]